MTLGELVKQYIDDHGLTYDNFGRRCGLSKAYISMLINNKNPKTGKPIVPTFETYIKISEAMDISIDVLFKKIDDAPIKIKSNTALNDSDAKEKLWKKREALRRDSKRRILFDLAENGTEKDVDAAVALIGALKATNPAFYDGDDPA